MYTKKKFSSVEFIENLLRSIAIAMLLLSLSYAAGSAVYLVNDSVANVLDKLELVIAIAVLALLLPKLVFKIRKLSAIERQDCFGSEGYVASVFKRSCVNGFKYTFLVLIAMDYVTGDYFADMPSNFFIKVIISLSMGIFAGTFFYLNRNVDDLQEDSVP